MTMVGFLFQSKCAEYWPNTCYGDTLRVYGDFSVLLQNREEQYDCVISQLRLKHMEVGYILSTVEHYCGVIMGAMASQVTSLTIVYSTVHSGADQRIQQSSASLAFVRRIHE